MKVVVIGGGIAGLIATDTLIRRGLRPTLVEAGSLGGQWAALRALKYLRYTEPLKARLADLGIEGEVEPVNGGAMVRPGFIVPHPRCLGWEGFGDRLMAAHWEKTRGCGAVDSRSMNGGPGGAPNPHRIRTNGADLAAALAARAREGADVHEGVPVAAIGKRTVSVGTEGIPYDSLVTTVPLWAFRGLWAGPEVGVHTTSAPTARRLFIKTYRAPSFSRGHSGWDYIYTPWTAHGVVHRVSPGPDDTWNAEANLLASQPEARMERDAADILGDDAELLATVRTHGHLLPLDAPPVYPDRVYPLGRFAQWDGRATVDKVLERSEVIAGAICDD